MPISRERVKFFDEFIKVVVAEEKNNVWAVGSNNGYVVMVALNKELEYPKIDDVTNVKEPFFTIHDVLRFDPGFNWDGWDIEAFKQAEKLAKLKLESERET